MLLYPDDYEGEEITIPAVPSIFASRRKGAPSSYWDDAHHEVKEGQSTQWLLDSGTTFHIIGIDEAMERQYTLKPLPQPITLNTANGQAVASHVAEFPFLGTEHGLRACVSVALPSDAQKGVGPNSLPSDKKIKKRVYNFIPVHIRFM